VVLTLVAADACGETQREVLTFLGMESRVDLHRVTELVCAYLACKEKGHEKSKEEERIDQVVRPRWRCCTDVGKEKVADATRDALVHGDEKGKSGRPHSWNLRGKKEAPIPRGLDEKFKSPSRVGKSGRPH
jgi:hypothetical protein